MVSLGFLCKNCQPIMGFLKGSLFVAFVILGLGAAYSTRGDGRDRRINAFLIYTLVLGLGVGLSQRENWPFSTWPLVAGLVPPTVSRGRVVAIDADGYEYPIDYRALAPLEYDEQRAWREKYFFGLERAAQDRVAAYLLNIIERNREEWSSGRRRYFDRYLGPFSAPFFMGHPEHWTQGEGVPAHAFRGLRFYKESWNVEERWRDPSKVIRRLVYEYREP